MPGLSFSAFTTAPASTPRPVPNPTPESRSNSNSATEQPANAAVYDRPYTQTPSPTPTVAAVPNYVPPQYTTQQSPEASESMIHEGSEVLSVGATGASYYFKGVVSGLDKAIPSISDLPALSNWAQAKQAATQVGETLEHGLAQPLDGLAIGSSETPFRSLVQAFVGGMGAEGGAALGTLAAPGVGTAAGAVGGYVAGSYVAGQGYDYVANSNTDLGYAVRTVNDGMVAGQQAIGDIGRDIKSYANVLGTDAQNAYNAFPGQLDQFNQLSHGYEQAAGNAAVGAYNAVADTAGQISSGVQGYAQQATDWITGGAWGANSVPDSSDLDGGGDDSSGDNIE